MRVVVGRSWSLELTNCIYGITFHTIRVILTTMLYSSFPSLLWSAVNCVSHCRGYPFLLNFLLIFHLIYFLALYEVHKSLIFMTSVKDIFHVFAEMVLVHKKFNTFGSETATKFTVLRNFNLFLYRKSCVKFK